MSELLKRVSKILVTIQENMPDTSDIEQEFLGMNYLPVDAAYNWRSKPSIIMQDHRGIVVQFETNQTWLKQFLKTLETFCKENDIEIKEK